MMEEEQISVGTHKTSNFSFGNSVWDHQRIDMYKYDNFDHCEFMEEYHLMTDYYIIILNQFHYYIVTFCGLSLIMIACLIWVMVVTYDDNDQCTRKRDLTMFHIHHVSEVLLYFILWFCILWKLNRNHILIQDYKYSFSLNVAIKNPSNSHEKLIIIDFLNTVIDGRSPFAIFGRVNPTNERVIALFTVIVLPAFWYVYRFVEDIY